MRKVFNENSFIKDYRRLMSAQRPSNALKHQVLDRMDEARSRISYPSYPDLKTRKRNIWPAVSAVAAVLAVVLALYLIYPIFMKSFQMGSASPAQVEEAAKTEAAKTEAAKTEAAKTEAAMAEPYTKTQSELTLSMALDDPILSLDELKLKTERTLRIRNTSMQTYVVGLSISLEGLDSNSQWRKIELPQSLVWPALAYEIPAAKQTGEASIHDETIDFSQLLTHPKPGQYRIVKQLGDKTLTAEFEIIP